MRIIIIVVKSGIILREIKKKTYGEFWLYNYVIRTNYFSKQFTSNEINELVCMTFAGND